MWALILYWLDMKCDLHSCRSHGCRLWEVLCFVRSSITHVCFIMHWSLRGKGGISRGRVERERERGRAGGGGKENVHCRCTMCMNMQKAPWKRELHVQFRCTHARVTWDEGCVDHSEWVLYLRELLIVNICTQKCAVCSVRRTCVNIRVQKMSTPINPLQKGITVLSRSGLITILAQNEVWNLHSVCMHVCYIHVQWYGMGSHNVHLYRVIMKSSVARLCA